MDLQQGTPAEKNALEIITLKVGSQARAMLRYSDQVIVIVGRRGVGVAITSNMAAERVPGCLADVIQSMRQEAQR